MFYLISEAWQRLKQLETIKAWLSARAPHFSMTLELGQRNKKTNHLRGAFMPTFLKPTNPLFGKKRNTNETQQLQSKPQHPRPRWAGGLPRKQLESANQFLSAETQNQEDAMREHSRKMKDALFEGKRRGREGKPEGKRRGNQRGKKNEKKENIY